MSFNKEKFYGGINFLDLSFEAKRRRVVGDDMFVTSTLSSFGDSRSYFFIFSETLDDSFLSIFGNFLAIILKLKEKFRVKYGRIEFIFIIE